MAKDKLTEYDATAANNTVVGDVNIAENCPPSGINNAIREVMSHLKDYVSGTGSQGLTLGGNLVIPDAGTIGSASDADSITIAANGETTFSQDVQVDDITVRDGGHLGSVSDPDALSIAANGEATFSQDVRVDDMTVRDGGHYGSVSNATAISVNAAGAVTMTQSLTVASGTYSPALFIGDSQYKIYVASGKLYIQNNTGGFALSSGSTSWEAVSDERAKDIIEPIENALSKIDSLRAVIGKYKVKETHSEDVLYTEQEWKPTGKSTGDVKNAKGSAKVGDDAGVRRSFLIAQDVEKVFPEAVDATDQDNLGLRYTDIIPLLVASIKELKAKVESLEAEITTLKGSG